MDVQRAARIAAHRFNTMMRANLMLLVELFFGNQPLSRLQTSIYRGLLEVLRLDDGTNAKPINIGAYIAELMCSRQKILLDDQAIGQLLEQCSQELGLINQILPNQLNLQKELIRVQSQKRQRESSSTEAANKRAKYPVMSLEKLMEYFQVSLTNADIKDIAGLLQDCLLTPEQGVALLWWLIHLVRVHSNDEQLMSCIQEGVGPNMWGFILQCRFLPVDPILMMRQQLAQLYMTLPQLLIIAAKLTGKVNTLKTGCFLETSGSLSEHNVIRRKVAPEMSNECWEQMCSNKRAMWLTEMVRLGKVGSSNTKWYNYLVGIRYQERKKKREMTENEKILVEAYKQMHPDKQG